MSGATVISAVCRSGCSSQWPVGAEAGMRRGTQYAQNRRRALGVSLLLALDEGHGEVDPGFDSPIVVHLEWHPAEGP